MTEICKRPPDRIRMHLSFDYYGRMTIRQVEEWYPQGIQPVPPAEYQVVEPLTPVKEEKPFRSRLKAALKRAAGTFNLVATTHAAGGQPPRSPNTSAGLWMQSGWSPAKRVPTAATADAPTTTVKSIT